MNQIHLLSNIAVTELAKIYVFKKLPVARKQDFGYDLACVALGIRCACLVDVCALSVKNAQQVIRELRKKAFSFNNIFYASEQSTEQLFFVNVGLVSKLVPKDVSDSSIHNISNPEEALKSFTEFVEIGVTNPCSIECPSTVTRLLAQITSASTAEGSLGVSLTLLNDSSPHVELVPLAGLLLEYPVAYAPRETATDNLSGVTLNLFECTVVFEEEGHNPPRYSHTLLKFSCPATESLGDQLSSSSIVERLVKRFEPRLTGIGRTQVKHTVEVRDRIVF